jgi:hypothetical protein
MKRNVLLLLLAVLVFYSCAPKSEHEPTTLTTQTENDTYLHHSIWWAFVNKVFEAKLMEQKWKRRARPVSDRSMCSAVKWVLLANVEVEKRF